MISIIVPIFNVAPYLECCIQSICQQTYRDIEIILVDDGSTDRSGEICDTYAGQDSRIKVIHKQNGGLVSARQAGLQAANGAMIGAVDGDDWVESDFFMQMYLAQKKTGADIVTSGLFADFGESSHKVKDNFAPGLYDCEQLLPRLLYSGIFFEYGVQPHLVTKLFRREILEKNQMAVNPCICGGEDAAAVYPSVLDAGKVAITNICCYHYVQRSESLTHVESANEEQRLNILIEFLANRFAEKDVADILSPQLKQYKKYIYSLRCLQSFQQRILAPFGGLPQGAKVIIYGAGVLGQQIYRYLTNHHYAEILLWVDRNASYYQGSGMAVSLPKAIEELEEHYDYVLIANTVETIANEIRQYLLEMQIPAAKIRWFSDEFINE